MKTSQEITKEANDKIAQIARLMNAQTFEQHERKYIKIGDRVLSFSWHKKPTISLWFWPNNRDARTAHSVGIDFFKKDAVRVVKEIGARLMSGEGQTAWVAYRDRYVADQEYEKRKNAQIDRFLSLFPANAYARLNSGGEKVLDFRNMGETYFRGLCISDKRVHAESFSGDVDALIWALMYDLKLSDEFADKLGGAMVELFKLKPMKEHTDRYMLGEPFRDRTKIGIGLVVLRVIRETLNRHNIVQ